MVSKGTSEHTCSATGAAVRQASAFFERVQRCLSAIALLNVPLPADPEGNYVYWCAGPTKTVTDVRSGSTIAQVAALVAASEFLCREVKALAPARPGGHPRALFLEVDGYVVQVLPASSPDGRRLLARKGIRTEIGTAAPDRRLSLSSPGDEEAWA